jgi:hypothetical protein
VRRVLTPLAFALVLSSTGCAHPSGSTPAGVAPEGSYSFSGLVDGEVVSGVVDFADPILLSGSHGQCVRQVRGIRRWDGPLGIRCPGFYLRVRVNDDGSVQSLGIARLRRTEWREERVGCKTWSQDRKACVVWNTVLVEHDRWVEGTVEVQLAGD